MLMWVVSGGLGCLGPAPVDSPVTITDTSPLPTPPSFEHDLKAALQRWRGVSVVYHDTLGEGAGAWDGDPREPGPDTSLNCITWLQVVLADAFTHSPQDMAYLLHNFRYFGDWPSFATRKHYNEHWIYGDSAPLTSLEEVECQPDDLRQIHLDLPRFTHVTHTPCTLSDRAESDFTLGVLQFPSLLSCLKNVEPGPYVLFPVPSKRWLRDYGQKVGDMGVVHGLLLWVSPGSAAQDEDPLESRYQITHASISLRRVENLSLGAYLDYSQYIIDGFVIYKIDYDFWWQRNNTPTPDDRDRWECEQHAVQRGLTRKGNHF